MSIIPVITFGAETLRDKFRNVEIRRRTNLTYAMLRITNGNRRVNWQEPMSTVGQNECWNGHHVMMFYAAEEDRPNIQTPTG